MGFCLLIFILSNWKKKTDLNLRKDISTNYKLVNEIFSCMLLLITQPFIKHTLLQAGD